MFIDKLPIWGFIGKVEKLGAGGKKGAAAAEGEQQKEKLSLFTHIHFDVLYNMDRVIQVDISTGEGEALGGQAYGRAGVWVGVNPPVLQRPAVSQLNLSGCCCLPRLPSPSPPLQTPARR